MTDSQAELLRTVRALEARIRLLRGFGMQMVKVSRACEDGAQAGPARDAGSGSPEEDETGYRFGDGRRARWEQSIRSRRPVEPVAAREPESGRRQVHMFAPAPAQGEDPVAAPGSGWRPSPLTAQEAQARLDELRREIGDCSRCRLHEERTRVVFGEGNPKATLVLTGEGPGREEDRTGRPFVGRAGQLLDRILQAMGFRREDVYICNVVKCRPPNNRTPQDDEMRMCGQFLTRQIEILRPRHILAMGGTAAKYLIGTNQAMGRLRGRFFDHPSGARILPTYHPAYLLRNPAAKRDVWEDVQKVMAELREGTEGEA